MYILVNQKRSSSAAQRSAAPSEFHMWWLLRSTANMMSSNWSSSAPSESSTEWNASFSCGTKRPKMPPEAAAAGSTKSRLAATRRTSVEATANSAAIDPICGMRCQCGHMRFGSGATALASGRSTNMPRLSARQHEKMASSWSCPGSTQSARLGCTK